MLKNSKNKKLRRIILRSKKNYWHRCCALTVVAIFLTSSLLVISPNVVADPTDPWWDYSWLCRKEISVDYTKVSDDLTNFPILIDITDADLISHAQSNGNDVVFTDETPTKLSHEIESYNATNGHLVAWVNIPYLSSSEDTSIYMYYGNPSADNQQDVEGTWNSDFKAVHHLKESWSTSTGHFKDSTVNNHDGTLTDANANSAIDAGMAGNGFR